MNSVRSLIEHADGVTEEAITSRAVRHRMKPDRTLEVISVDVEGIIASMGRSFYQLGFALGTAKRFIHNWNRSTGGE